MKLRKKTAVAALALALTTTAGCGGKQGEPGDQNMDEEALPQYTAAKNVAIDSPVLAKAKKRGKLIIGSKADQPNLGFQGITSGEYTGFDVEIAKMVAADLGFDPDTQIQFKTIDSSIRETALSKGQVDLMVGSYTINDERKKQVDFAGPYYMAGQDLLVRKDEQNIKGPGSIKGKRVCSITGSTPLQNIKENRSEFGAEPVSFGKYTDCVKQLLDEQVDAMTTDDAILKGYAAQFPNKLKVVGKKFSEEPYGIGMKKGDRALQQAVTKAVERHQENGTYEKAYDATLGLSGSKFVEPPELEK